MRRWGAGSCLPFCWSRQELCCARVDTMRTHENRCAECTGVVVLGSRTCSWSLGPLVESTAVGSLPPCCCACMWAAGCPWPLSLAPCSLGPTLWVFIARVVWWLVAPHRRHLWHPWGVWSFDRRRKPLHQPGCVHSLSPFPLPSPLSSHTLTRTNDPRAQISGLCEVLWVGLGHPRPVLRCGRTVLTASSS